MSENPDMEIADTKVDTGLRTQWSTGIPILAGAGAGIHDTHFAGAGMPGFLSKKIVAGVKPGFSFHCRDLAGI